MASVKQTWSHFATISSPSSAQSIDVQGVSAANDNKENAWQDLHSDSIVEVEIEKSSAKKCWAPMTMNDEANHLKGGNASIMNDEALTVYNSKICKNPVSIIQINQSLGKKEDKIIKNLCIEAKERQVRSVPYNFIDDDCFVLTAPKDVYVSEAYAGKNGDDVRTCFPSISFAPIVSFHEDSHKKRPFRDNNRNRPATAVARFTLRPRPQSSYPDEIDSVNEHMQTTIKTMTDGSTSASVHHAYLRPLAVSVAREHCVSSINKDLSSFLDPCYQSVDLPSSTFLRPRFKPSSLSAFFKSPPSVAAATTPYNALKKHKLLPDKPSENHTTIDAHEDDCLCGAGAYSFIATPEVQSKLPQSSPPPIRKSSNLRDTVQWV